MKNLLFPHIFRLIGWCVFIPSLILGTLVFFNLIHIPSTIEIVVNDIAIIGTAVGALFVACSREKIEDEMTNSIRLSSLLYSIYIYVAVLIVCTIAINGLAYCDFLIINSALFPIIFVSVFRFEIARYNKINDDEE